MEATAPPPRPHDTQRGFFKSLMDTRFDHLITPKLVRFLYVVSMILIAIGTVGWIIAAFVNDAGTGILFLIVAPLVALVYLIVVRLYLELIVVAFKIREAADEVAANTRRAEV